MKFAIMIFLHPAETGLKDTTAGTVLQYFSDTESYMALYQ